MAINEHDLKDRGWTKIPSDHFRFTKSFCFENRTMFHAYIFARSPAPIMVEVDFLVGGLAASFSRQYRHDCVSVADIEQYLINVADLLQFETFD